MDKLLEFFAKLLDENKTSAVAILGASLVLTAVLHAKLLKGEDAKVVFGVLMGFGLLSIVVSSIYSCLNSDKISRPILAVLKWLRNSLIFSSTMVIISFEEDLFSSHEWGLAGAWMAVSAVILIALIAGAESCCYKDNAGG